MTQSIWSKLFTALRGGANEVGESIVDQQALRILDQEIRDADSALANAKRELVTIMAKHKLSTDRVSEYNAKIQDLERSEEHTSELQSLMRISYAVFCLKKKKFNYIKKLNIYTRI